LSFLLLQDPDDLLFHVSTLLHPALPLRSRENSSFPCSCRFWGGQYRTTPSATMVENTG
jgi:hypothetical protein